MDTAEFKEKLIPFVKEYNGHSWQWMPNNYFSDLLELTRGTILQPNQKLAVSEEQLKIDSECISLFLDAEKYITNNRFFWGWAPEIYCKQTFSQNSLDKFTEAFLRHDRLKVPFSKRMEYKNFYKEKILFNTGKPFGSKRLANKFVKKIRKTKTDLIVYRGFSIHKEADIREGRYKVGNPNAEKQSAGIGLSYTLNRQVAKFFATQYYIENGKFYWLGHNKKHDEKPSIPSHIKNEIIDIDTSRSVVASYSIHKDDLIYFESGMAEYEVISFPHKAKLLRYDFVNPKEVVLYPTDLLKLNT